MLKAAPHRGSTSRVIQFGRSTLGASWDHETGGGSVALGSHGAAVFCGNLDDREKLEREFGTDFPDDASLVLAAWSRWGDNVWGRLRGSYNIAVTDGERIQLARDHFGNKPLFYRSESRALYAATEAKQVVQGAGLLREPDLDSLESILYGRPLPGSALSGISRVDRASSLCASDPAFPSQHRYWRPEELIETRTLGRDEVCEELLHHLDRACERAVTGNDVVLLSGGIDSPSIAALAAPVHLARSGQRLKALSAVFPDHPSVDESPHIISAVDHIGLEWHSYVPRASALDDASFWGELLDGPVETLSIPQVSEAYSHSAALGARRVFTGELAEHVFEIRNFLMDHLISRGRFRAAALQLRSRRAEGLGVIGMLKQIAQPLIPPRVAFGWARRRRRDERQVPPWIDPARIGGIGYQPDLIRSPRDRWTALQTTPFYGQAVSFEADDICAAFHGVDVRRPFGDVDLWSFVLSLRAEDKFPDAVPKSIIRTAMRGRVPDTILDRRDKTVFDEYSISKADYDSLRRWLSNPDARMPGVDYGILSDRIDRQKMSVPELRWARDLGRIHAFLAGWDR